MNVVRPLDCFPEHRALVTERVDGVRLEVLLRAGGARRHGELLHDCGRFLRAYHERLGQLARQRDTASTFMHRCGVYLARLEQGGVDARTREHLRAGFEHAVLRLPTELPSCLTFDDYSVRNLLVRGRRFFLVEAPLPRQKLIYDDLACFLVSLTMVFWGTPWFLLGAVPPPALGRRFLEGYFADAAPDPLIALFCAKNLCFRWCRALDTLSGRTSRIAGALYSTLLPRHVNRVFFQHVMTHLQQATRAGGDRSTLPARRP
jgi:hypothetical protein